MLVFRIKTVKVLKRESFALLCSSRAELVLCLARLAEVLATF